MRVGVVTMGGTSGGSRGQVDGGAPGGGGEQPAGSAQTGGRSLLPHPGGACGPRGWRAAPLTRVRADFPGPRAPARGRGEHRAGVPPPPAQPLVHSRVPLPTSRPPAPRPGVRGFLRAAGHAAEQTRISGHRAWWAGADRKPASPRVEELWVSSSSRWAGDARRTEPGSPLAVGTPHSCREGLEPQGAGHRTPRGLRPRSVRGGARALGGTRGRSAEASAGLRGEGRLRSHGRGLATTICSLGHAAGRRVPGTRPARRCQGQRKHAPPQLLKTLVARQKMSRRDARPVRAPRAAP